MADALDTLVRLRTLEADHARRALGEAIAQENRARTVADAAREARAREAKLAVGDPADPFADAFAAWLPVSVQAIEAAEADRDRHVSATEAARQTLTSQKAALKAVELLVAERNSAERRVQARHAQRRLDELSHRLGQGDVAD